MILHCAKTTTGRTGPVERISELVKRRACSASSHSRPVNGKHQWDRLQRTSAKSKAKLSFSRNSTDVDDGVKIASREEHRQRHRHKVADKAQVQILWKHQKHRQRILHNRKNRHKSRSAKGGESHLQMKSIVRRTRYVANHCSADVSCWTYSRRKKRNGATLVSMSTARAAAAVNLRRERFAPSVR